MSRAAINKHIQTIREWGLDVFTVPGKGYSLPGAIQLLEAERILSLLEDKRVSVLPVVDSTNQYLLDRIAELHSGDACVAEYQQAGEGAAGGSGSRHSALIYTCRCSGDWSRGRLRPWGLA